MTNIDGIWNISIQEPTGVKKGILTLRTSADGFTGNLSDNGQTVEVTDGKIEGDTLTWSMKITKPIPLTLRVLARVDGSSMSGAVTAGMLGSFPLTGARA
jgi:hypothetical protein